jgi:spore germination protein GerM
MRNASAVVAIVLVAPLLALVASGCGGGAAQSAGAATDARPTSFETTLYFLTPDGSAPIGVRRSLKRTSPFAIQVMRALLAGRTQAEKKRGLRTAIPDGTKLVSLRIVRNRIAVVSLTGLPANGSPVDRVRVITQIARSLISLSGIEQVRLRNEGKPWGLWLMTGRTADIAYGYRELLGFTGVSGAGGSFAALP